MSVFDENLELFYQEGHDVIVYPVVAESVAPFLASGGTGETVRGLFYTRDQLAGDGDVQVEVTPPYFETLKTRALAAGIAEDTTSIEHKGERYNVIRGTFKDPGFMLYQLEEIVS